MSLKNWSTTASSNATVDSINFAEGQAPSSLNDSARALMADVRAALYTKGSDIASATTTDLAAASTEGLFHDITGTTTITGLGTAAAGVWKVVKFEGALTLTHNATSLILPGAANITTADGDVAIFVSEGSGNWRCVSYKGALGDKIGAATGTSLTLTGTLTSAEQTVTASSTTGMQINQSAAGQQGLGVLVSNGSYAGTAFYVNSTRAASSAFDLINLATNGTARFRVSGVGGIVSTPASGIGLDVTGASSSYALSVTANASASSQAALFTLQAGSTSTTIDVWDKNTSGDNRFLQFFTEGSATLRGSITYNRGGGVVAYNTTSDYRAKTITGKLENTGEVIDALKVYRGTMHGATIERPMLIAHEAQEVVPYAVNGEKDALNEDGSPKFQTMDHQILVPLLIAEVQALRARVAALEASP